MLCFAPDTYSLSFPGPFPKFLSVNNQKYLQKVMVALGRDSNGQYCPSYRPSYIIDYDIFKKCKLCICLKQSIFSLNALKLDRYLQLHDRYQAIFNFSFCFTQLLLTSSLSFKKSKNGHWP